MYIHATFKNQKWLYFIGKFKSEDMSCDLS